MRSRQLTCSPAPTCCALLRGFRGSRLDGAWFLWRGRMTVRTDNAIRMALTHQFGIASRSHTTDRLAAVLTSAPFPLSREKLGYRCRSGPFPGYGGTMSRRLCPSTTNVVRLARKETGDLAALNPSTLQEAQRRSRLTHPDTNCFKHIKYTCR